MAKSAKKSTPKRRDTPEQKKHETRQFHISPGFVPHHPTFVDRPLNTSRNCSAVPPAFRKGGVD
jgi:hypothetical protein